MAFTYICGDSDVWPLDVVFICLFVHIMLMIYIKVRCFWCMTFRCCFYLFICSYYTDDMSKCSGSDVWPLDVVFFICKQSFFVHFLYQKWPCGVYYVQKFLFSTLFLLNRAISLPKNGGFWGSTLPPQKIYHRQSEYFAK